MTTDPFIDDLAAQIRSGLSATEYAGDVTIGAIGRTQSEDLVNRITLVNRLAERPVQATDPTVLAKAIARLDAAPPVRKRFLWVFPYGDCREWAANALGIEVSKAEADLSRLRLHLRLKAVAEADLAAAVEAVNRVVAAASRVSKEFPDRAFDLERAASDAATASLVGDQALVASKTESAALLQMVASTEVLLAGARSRLDQS